MATRPMAKVETHSSALEARNATRSTAAVRCASSAAARSTRPALVADRPEGTQRAHGLKPLKDLAGKLRHLVHLPPAYGLGAEAGHRHVDRNHRGGQREQHANHPADLEDHCEDDGRARHAVTARRW